MANLTTTSFPQFVCFCSGITVVNYNEELIIRFENGMLASVNLYLVTYYMFRFVVTVKGVGVTTDEFIPPLINLTQILVVHEGLFKNIVIYQ